jgi:hypothetical protein
VMSPKFLQLRLVTFSIKFLSCIPFFYLEPYTKSPEFRDNIFNLFSLILQCLA